LQLTTGSRRLADKSIVVWSRTLSVTGKEFWCGPGAGT